MFSSIQIITTTSCHLSYSSKGCKQVIKHSNFIINHHHSIKLSTCWWPQTSGYSYSRVAPNRIDVHPAGEKRPICQTHPTLSPRVVPDHTYLTRSMHSNISCSHQQIWTDPLPSRRRAPDPTHSTTTDRSVGLYLASLPQLPMRQ
jgi:hypothetical protein